LKSEYVAISAHLDHLGIGAVKGDKIYNGAMDNASGVRHGAGYRPRLKTGTGAAALHPVSVFHRRGKGLLAFELLCRTSHGGETSSRI
jgi:hypothetical protein